MTNAQINLVETQKHCVLDKITWRSAVLVEHLNIVNSHVRVRASHPALNDELEGGLGGGQVDLGGVPAQTLVTDHSPDHRRLVQLL